jgi:hypothetical protein
MKRAVHTDRVSGEGTSGLHCFQLIPDLQPVLFRAGERWVDDLDRPLDLRIVRHRTKIRCTNHRTDRLLTNRPNQALPQAPLCFER